MSASALRPGSLVLYKIHPAIVDEVGEKIAIQLPDGKTRRVRDKDIRLLHPGPLQSLGSLSAAAPALDEAWELLEGETVPLSDLAEFLFGEYSPATAWAAWGVVDDGLYFEGSVDAVRRRSAEAIATDKAEREARRQAEADWAAFLQRVEAGSLVDEDRKRLAEVERVALGDTERSRILQSLDVQETPEAAHRFLMRCGYWRVEHNPWPRRVGARLGPVEIGVPDLPTEPRRDLTGLESWAIDDPGNQDPDDAISIDGDTLWVHVADVASVVRADGHVDLAARERSANLYLPDAIHPMLPDVVTERLGLGLAEESPALSFGFRFDGQQVVDVEIVASIVRVRRASYDDIDQRMDQAPFSRLRELTDRYRAGRIARGAARIDLPEVAVRVEDGKVVIRPLPKLASRDMVTDAMLMAGEAAARYAQAREIPIPYAIQPEPGEIRQPEGMVEMYAYRRFFKPSRVSLDPGRHFGLGLDMYARATSPLRRYVDLVVHQQLRAAAAGQETASAEAVMQRIAGIESAGAIIRKTERLSNLHWKLVFLSQNPGWRGEAVVVALEERKAVVIVPELAMETRIRLSSNMTLGQSLMLAVREVDLPGQVAYFQVA